MKSYKWLMEHAPMYDIGQTSGLPDKIAGRFLNDAYNSHKGKFKEKKRNYGGQKMARRNYRRSYRRYSRGARRSYGRKAGLALSPAFLAGALIGVTHMDDKIPKQLVLIGATVPVRGIGTVKAVAQGLIFGNVLQNIKAGGLSSSGFQGVG